MTATNPAASYSGPCAQLSAQLTVQCANGGLDVTGRSLQSILRAALDPANNSAISLQGAITEFIPWVELQPVTIHREIDPINTFISTDEDAMNYRLACAQANTPCTQAGFMARILERYYGIIARTQEPSTNGHHPTPPTTTPAEPPAAQDVAPPEISTPRRSSKYRKIHYPLTRQRGSYTYNGPVGEEHSLSKLTTAQVREIRELWPSVLDEANGKSQSACRVLGQVFGCTGRNILSIVSGVTWKHLLDPQQPSPKLLPRPTKRAGEGSPAAKLNANQVLEIRKCWPKVLAGHKGIKSRAERDLANTYNVTPANIQQIISRRTWRHV